MNQSTSPTQRRHLFGALEKQSLRVFTLFLLICSGALFYVSSLLTSAYKEVLISFAISLFSSLVFANLYGFIVDRHRQNAVNVELEHSVEKAIEKMRQAEQTHIQEIVDLTLAKIEEVEKSYYHQISHHFHELIPARSFSATEKPDRVFNEVLANELAHSRSYLFKGVTGRYLGSRLRQARRRNLTCQVLLTDPTQEELLHLYVKDRFIPLSNSEMQQRVEQVQREIYMTIVDLYDSIRWAGAIDLRVYRGPVFYRTEIMDGFLVLSYYTAQQPTAYPLTYLYEKDSLYYMMYLMDFHQTFELAETSFSLQTKTTEQELSDFLRKLGCDPAHIPQLRAEAQAFRQEFFTQLGWRFDA